MRSSSRKRTSRSTNEARFLPPPCQGGKRAAGERGVLHFQKPTPPHKFASPLNRGSSSRGMRMKQIGVAVIGTGWCGGIRAETLAKHPLVKSLHLAESRRDRLDELNAKLKPPGATADYKQLLGNREIEAVYISATPESTHYPMAKDALAAGKHVFLEKPIAMTLAEADELIATARTKNLKFTIGYSQRFNPKYAYVRKCIRDGTIGKPVTALVSRHITRMLGTKISGRSKLSPAAMEATHDLDFVFWCLEPAKPVRVYSQQNYGAMRAMSGGDVPDQQWVMVTMDNGISVVVGRGWSLPR